MLRDSIPIWTEQSKPIKAATGPTVPTKVESPLLVHSPPLWKPTSGEPPSLLGDQIHRGIKIRIPRICRMTKRPSTIGSFLTRKVLKMIAIIMNARVRRDPCHLWKL
jgi:hypothetical protein